MLAIISVAKTIVFGSHQVLKIQKIGGETDFSGYLNNVSDNLRDASDNFHRISSYFRHVSGFICPRDSLRWTLSDEFRRGSDYLYRGSNYLRDVENHLYSASNYLREESKFLRERENRFRHGYGCRWRSEKSLNITIKGDRRYG